MRTPVHAFKGSYSGSDARMGLLATIAWIWRLKNQGMSINRLREWAVVPEQETTNANAGKRLVVDLPVATFYGFL